MLAAPAEILPAPVVAQLPTPLVGLVCPARPGTTLATCGWRCLCDLAERNHAPTDAGGDRFWLLRAIPPRRPPSRPWPQPRSKTCCDSGRAGLLSAGAAASSGGPANRLGATGDNSPARLSNCAVCPASGAIRPGPSSPSPSTSRSRSWKPTPRACSAACWPTAAIPARRPARSCAGRWRKCSCRSGRRAVSIRP